MEPKKCKTRLRCTMIVCCFFVGIVQSDLFAQTPIQALQGTIDQLQSTLRASDLEEDIRIAQVREITMERFDFREMSKRILGPHWAKNFEKQDKFVSEFTEYMKRTFVNNVTKIKDLKVFCQNEETNGSTAKVITSISMPNEEFKIKFQMYSSESGWKIYDIVLGNDSFSIVSSYRAQFHWILQVSSFEDLLQIIRAKNT
jgi:phospholipid transport system substrate-binding protein